MRPPIIYLSTSRQGVYRTDVKYFHLLSSFQVVPIPVASDLLSHLQTTALAGVGWGE